MDFKRVNQWQSFRFVPNHVLPSEWREWILDRGSLTKRLIKASGGDFRVRVVKLAWEYPEINELKALGIRYRCKALIREVELICKGEVWVCARSVIPSHTLTGEERQLKYLGTRPLGAFLFKSKTMERKAIELARFTSSSDERIYGRRSVFLLHGKPLLVSELFSPKVVSSKETADTVFSV